MPLSTSLLSALSESAQTHAPSASTRSAWPGHHVDAVHDAPARVARELNAANGRVHGTSDVEHALECTLHAPRARAVEGGEDDGHVHEIGGAGRLTSCLCSSVCSVRRPCEKRWAKTQIALCTPVISIVIVWRAYRQSTYISVGSPVASHNATSSSAFSCAEHSCDGCSRNTLPKSQSGAQSRKLPNTSAGSALTSTSSSFSFPLHWRACPPLRGSQRYDHPF